MSEGREVQRGMGPDQGHTVGTWLSEDRDQGSDCPDQGFSPEAWNLSDSQHSSSRCFAFLPSDGKGPGPQGSTMAGWLLPGDRLRPGSFSCPTCSPPPWSQGLPPHPLSPVSDNDSTRTCL